MITELHRTRALQAAALCLHYPDPGLSERIDLLCQTAATLPPSAAQALGRFASHLRNHDQATLAREYVDTFDLRRRCSLYLTYYTHGDTRKRGMALLEFTAAYRDAGMTVADGELPDHLGVLCEVTARAPQVGLDLFHRNRVSVELLRMALADADSPYVDPLDLIRSVLPEPAPSDLSRALDLARSGPPAEEVGLEPFAPPEYMGGRR